MPNKLFERAQRVNPRRSQLPRTRLARRRRHTAASSSRGEGSHIFDADGNEYIDYIGSWGPLLLGHRHPEILAAIEEALTRGTSFGAPTEQEIELAETIRAMVPSMELVRLVNSGTEATMSALRVARGFTGRDITIKFEGCYHGHVDSLLVKAGSGVATLGLPDSPGVPKGFSDTTITLPFNNSEAVEQAFEKSRRRKSPPSSWNQSAATWAASRPTQAFSKPYAAITAATRLAPDLR